MAETPKTDEEWRAALSDDEYHVMREHGTERAWAGDLLENKRPGLYSCRGCGAALFKSGTKFDSGSGWPSFYESVDPAAVTLIEDRTFGMDRTEIRCAACGSHLGHVFPDGTGTPTGERYCVNSICLTFAEDGDSQGSDEPRG